MNNLNAPIEVPQQSTGSTFLQWAIGITLVVAGFRIGYCTDTDWDKDGISNDIETKCHMDSHKADSDGDGITDNKDPYPLSAGVPENFVVCLTLENQEKLCSHPTDIIQFDEIIIESPDKTRRKVYQVFYWKAGMGIDAVNVKENLEQVEDMMHQIGYPHFYRVNSLDLPNMLLADCLSYDTLFMSQEDNLWCHVTKKNLQTVKRLVDYRNCKR